MNENESDYHQSLIPRTQPEEDFEYRFPVGDCPLCKEKNIPFGVVNFVDDGFPRQFRYCLSCSQIPEELKIKGYVCYLDLEDLGWSEKL